MDFFSRNFSKFLSLKAYDQTESQSLEGLRDSLLLSTLEVEYWNMEIRKFFAKEYEYWLSFVIIMNNYSLKSR